ncbi:hypothetical protein EYZ11_012068 [Aspergillus tanneri]|nr:hypothetical protein EYZ11_012068 [Aspergillus tanneri]
MDRWTEYFSTPSLSSDSTKAYWYSDQSADFFSEEDHEDICTGLDSKWECKHCSRNPADQNHPWFMNTEDEEELAKNLSFSQSELPTSPGEGGQSYPDMFDKIIDAVNTARDIAHVIWNVGWRR